MTLKEVKFNTYHIYSSISHTFLYLKFSPKTGVRLILEVILVLGQQFNIKLKTNAKTISFILYYLYVQIFTM